MANRWLQSFKQGLHRAGAPLQRLTDPLTARWQRFAARRPRLARWVRRFTIMGMVIVLLLTAFLLPILTDAPSIRTLRNIQTEAASEIYSADGVLLGRFYKQNRTVVQYQNLPPHLIYALVATEDARFFKHRGVDYRSWARVLYRTILQGDESGGGGSTISQQLAKNLYPRKEYQFLSIVVNKLREIIIAIRLERAYSKEELLALYLNTVPFSENVYGIETASRRFFSKAPAELTIEEAAVLIGTLQATDYYRPTKFPERARERRNVVLSQMTRNDYLPVVQRDSLQKLPLELCYNPVVDNSGIAPYFREYLRQELPKLLDKHRKPNGEPYDLMVDGLKIYTSLDTRIQRIAEEAVQEHVSSLQRTFDQHWRGQNPWGKNEQLILAAMRNSDRYKQLKEKGVSETEIERIFNTKIKMTVFSWEGDKEVEMSPLDSVRYAFKLLQIGFIAMEPYTGHIRAWIGGVDFDHYKYDHVLARRQVGSAFKPLVYTQAIRTGLDPCEQISNELVSYHQYAKGDWARRDWRREDPEPNFDENGKDLDDWVPQNADGKYGGSYSMEGALTNSINTVTVKLMMLVGFQNVINLAHRMGIDTVGIPKEPSIALGTAQIPLKEMVTAFSVFASRGLKVRPTIITKIETSDGKILVNFEKPLDEQVIDTLHADIVTQMMQSVTQSGTASRIRWKYRLDNALAGKTGTSQNHADGWFVGFIPNLVAGAWVGGDSPLVRFRNYQNGQGAATALPVWALFMRKLLEQPEFASWKEAKFAELNAEVKRSLSCPAHIRSAAEIFADSVAAAERDSLSRVDSLGNPQSLELIDNFDNE
jgi:penicillin-binding protein 1A